MNKLKMHLIQGDCLEILPKIESRSIDCIITDPPYFIGFKSSAVKEGTTSGRQDWGNHTMLTPLFDRIFKEYERILKRNGRVFMFTDWRTYPTLYFSASKFMRISNMIVWDYGWIKAGTQFRFTHELILHTTMPETKSPKNRSLSDVWRIKPINFTQKRHHQAEKPTAVIDVMLKNTTKEGDTILDSFLGSGTTMLSCLKNKRNCIGIEINNHHIETSKKRLNWGSSLNPNIEWNFEEVFG